MPFDDRSPTRSDPNDQRSADPADVDPIDSSPDASKAPAPWVRLTGAGLELAVTAILFGAIGAVVDRLVQTERPVFAAVIGLIGFSVGMVRFIRLATSVSAAQRDADADGIASARNETKK